MADYNLGTARGRIEIDAAGVGKGLSDANNELDKFQGKTGNTSGQLVKTGTVMLGAATVIAGGFALAVNSAADFEKVISGIAAVSGATGPELDKVRAKALQLGADTAFSAGEAAGAMEELIKAGLSVDDVLNGAADATVNLAAAGEVDLTTAATIASNAMNQFSLSAGDMPHVADLIAGAANASAIDVNEFGMSLSQAGAVANLAGMTFDDLSLAIAAMGNAGIKGSDAGTSLKSFLQNLQPTTEKQINLMKELGIVTEDGANQFYDAAGSLKPMNEIAGVLSTSLSGLTDQQKQMALETMFGSDAIRAAAVIADTGSAGFDALSASVGKTSAADVAATRMDNLSGSIEQLKGSAETLLIIIGRPLADALRGIVDHLTGLVNWFTQLDASTLDTIVTVGKIVATFLGVAGATLIIIGTIEKLKLAWEALNILIAANPIVFVIGLIIALGAALYVLYQRNETFRHAVQALFGWLQENVLPIIQMIVSAFQEFWTVLTSGMTENEGGSWWENLAFAIRDVAKWIKNVLIPALVDMAKWFNDNVVPPIVTAGKWLGWLGTEVIERLVSAFGWFRDHVWPVLFSFGELVGAIVGRAIQLFQIFIDIIADLGRVFNDEVMPLIIFALNIMQVAIEMFVGTVQNIWANFNDVIFGVVDMVWRRIQDVVNAALLVIQGIIDTLTSLIKGDWEGVWTGIQEIFEGIWNYMEGIPGMILEAIILVIQTAIAAIITFFQNWDVALRAIFGDMWEAVKSTTVDAVTAVVDFVLSIPGRLGDLAGMLVDKGVAIISGLLTGISNKFMDVIDYLASFPQAILNAAVGFDRLLWDAGVAIIQGLWDGMKSLWDDVTGWLSNLNPANWKGPEERDKKMLHDPGIWIMQGLLRGMQAGWADAKNWLRTVDAATYLAPTISAAVAPRVSGGTQVSHNFSSLDLAFHFGNEFTSAKKEEIKAAVTSDDVLDNILKAARARRG